MKNFFLYIVIELIKMEFDFVFTCINVSSPSPPPPKAKIYSFCPFLEDMSWLFNKVIT